MGETDWRGLLPGQAITGNICFHIPENLSNLALVIQREYGGWTGAPIRVM